MAERWASLEGRVAAVDFRDANGVPVTGLAPSAVAYHKDGSAGAPSVSVVEIAAGFYRVVFAAALAKDVVVRVDGGGSLASTRYVGLEVPVGGYVDRLDVAVSSRATPADVTVTAPLTYGGTLT